MVLGTPSFQNQWLTPGLLHSQTQLSTLVSRVAMRRQIRLASKQSTANGLRMRPFTDHKRSWLSGFNNYSVHWLAHDFASPAFFQWTSRDFTNCLMVDSLRLALQATTCPLIRDATLHRHFAHYLRRPTCETQSCLSQMTLDIACQPGPQLSPSRYWRDDCCGMHNTD